MSDDTKTLGGGELQERAQREVDAYNELVTVRIPAAQQALQELEQERLQRLGKITALQELLQEINPEGVGPPGTEVAEPAASEAGEDGAAQSSEEVAASNGSSKGRTRRRPTPNGAPRQPRKRK